MANSRRKGNKAERVAASLVAQWTGKTFSRTPSSGGLQWKNTHSKGDIVCTKEGHYFPFCIEVKAHKEINFSHLLYDVDAVIMDFWSQCVRDAYLAKKVPMLMMRYNGLPSEFFFLAIPTLFYSKLLLDQQHINRVMKYHNRKSTLPAFTIVSSRAFFNSDYKSVKQKALKYLKNEGKIK